MHPYGRAGSPERKSNTNLASFSPFGSRGLKSKDKQTLAPSAEAATWSRRRSNSQNQSSAISGVNATSATTPIQQPSENTNGTILEDPSERPALDSDLINGGPSLQLPQILEPSNTTNTLQPAGAAEVWNFPQEMIYFLT
jgi:hypothetical protein